MALLAGIIAHAQSLTIPRPSPTCRVEQEFATSKITIDYSRPGVKGRTVFGDLVPYGKVWRTGANAATKIKFGEDVQVQGNNVPAGKYGFYTIPDKTEWTIIFSKDTILWGDDGYKAENDLLRFKVQPEALPSLQETFTIEINNIRSESCDITLKWEKTSVTFSVKADIDSKIMKQIDEAMNVDKRPYGPAATYYFENGKDLNQAYAWITKAVEKRPDAYWYMTTKAKIEMKLGKYNDALATATAAKDLATKDSDVSYIQQNEKIIAEAKSKAN
jgi:hypothetical protein